MKKNKSFESKDLLPSFILEGSSPDYENIPEDINDINPSDDGKNRNNDQTFFDSNSSNINNSNPELSDESISLNSNDTYEEEDESNSNDYLLNLKGLNDSSLFQKISFFEKDQKIWSRFGSDKINMINYSKIDNNDKMINQNIIKDINKENELADIKTKEDMNNGNKGTLNDFTQNLNNINFINIHENKNKNNINGVTNSTQIEISNEQNKLKDNNNGIKNNSNYKIFNNDISFIHYQNILGLNYMKPKDEEKNNESENSKYYNIKEEIDFIKFTKFCEKLNEPLFNYICSKEGSKKIANLLNSYNDLKANYLIQNLYMNFELIICNKYGNYFFQRLYLMSRKESRLKILNIITKYFITISKDKIGICAIQNIIQAMQTFEERNQIINCLKGYELEMSLDKEGTHLIQSIIDYFPEKERQNLTDVLCTMRNIKILITNINSVHIIKRFIERNKIQFNRNKLIEALYLNINFTLNNSKGCYIISYLIQKWGINSGIIFINVLLSNLEFFANRKQSLILIKKIMHICVKNCKLYMHYCNNNIYFIRNSCEYILLRNLKIYLSKINSQTLFNKLV